VVNEKQKIPIQKTRLKMAGLSFLSSRELLRMHTSVTLSLIKVKPGFVNPGLLSIKARRKQRLA
jgi:hypothetical protein